MVASTRAGSSVRMPASSAMYCVIAYKDTELTGNPASFSPASSQPIWMKASQRLSQGLLSSSITSHCLRSQRVEKPPDFGRHRFYLCCIKHRASWQTNPPATLRTCSWESTLARYRLNFASSIPSRRAGAAPIGAIIGISSSTTSLSSWIPEGAWR